MTEIKFGHFTVIERCGLYEIARQTLGFIFTLFAVSTEVPVGVCFLAALNCFPVCWILGIYVPPQKTIYYKDRVLFEVRLEWALLALTYLLYFFPWSLRDCALVAAYAPRLFSVNYTCLSESLIQIATQFNWEIVSEITVRWVASYTFASFLMTCLNKSLFNWYSFSGLQSS